jgi:hypothetical protein
MNNITAIGNISNTLSVEGINIKETKFIVTGNKNQENLCDSDLLDSEVEMKKRKNRRGRRQTYCPYYQLSDSQRLTREEREKMRIVKLRKKNEGKRLYYCTI